VHIVETVWVSPEESLRIAAHLGLTLLRFHQQYCQPQDFSGWHFLKSKPATEGSKVGTQVCMFLDEASNACTIHSVRPSQCSTFPWWPELMYPRVWEDVKGNLCEGLDHPDAGRLDTTAAADQLAQATAQTIQLETQVKPLDFEEQMYGPEG